VGLGKGLALSAIVVGRVTESDVDALARALRADTVNTRPRDRISKRVARVDSRP
jgi:hypothetical protein